MNKSAIKFILILLLIAGLFVGCSQGTTGTNTSDMTSEEIQTAAAETLVVLGTQEISEQTMYYVYAPMISSGDNQKSESDGSTGEEVDNTATIVPTETRTPTKTIIPNTATPTVTPTPDSCYAAKLVQHINVKPGTVFTGGTKFTKIWRVENVGSCPWYATYTLVLVSGDGLGGGSETPINAAVAPGQTVDLMIDLTAPKNNGRYKSAWMLYNLAGQVFGVGDNATEYLWVDIKVVNAATATSKSSSPSSTPKPANTTAPTSTTAPSATQTNTPTPSSTPTPTPTFTETPTLTATT